MIILPEFHCCRASQPEPTETLGDLATAALATALRSFDGITAERFVSVLATLADRDLLGREVQA